MQNKSALVVDDSRVARMTLIKYLRTHGFEIIEQGSGEDALNWLAATEQKPDIIFMDVMMEGMDGLTATRRIKGEAEWASIPVIICTGNDTDADHNAALATGAEAVLSKPPAEDAVEHILNQLESKPEIVAVEVKAEAAPAAIDEEAIVDKAMRRFQEQVLPDIQRQAREMAEDISRQIATDVATEITAQQLPSLLPELSQKALEAANAELVDAKQQLLHSVLATLPQMAQHAVDQAMQEYGLTEKLMGTLRSEGLTWLKQQESTVRTSLQSELQVQLEKGVSQYLDEQLPSRLAGLSAAQTEENEHAVYEQQINALQNQVATTSKIAVAAILVAVIAVALPFII